MLNFTFQNPTKIIFGKDRLKELHNVIPKDAKVLILYGGGSVKQFGTLPKVIEALGKRDFMEFAGIEPNPKFNTLMKAVELVKQENINFLLAVGGGSVMDGTKFVALATEYTGENALDLLLDRTSHMKIKTALPIGTVVTLPATGSEMNAGGVISGEHGKLSFGNPLVYPKFSILDPTLTFTLPKTQIANGIIDTFIHTTEQYLTYPVEARLQDRMAEGILQTLLEIGPITLEEPTNYDARANLMWCATMALNGVIGAGVPQDWCSHVIGHEITAKYSLDHAKTLAIIAPSVWSELKEQKREKLLQYAERVWKILEGDEDVRIHRAIENTRQFFERLGVKTRFSDYDMGPECVEELVKGLEQHGMKRLSETRKVTLEVSRKIIEASL